MFRRAFWVLLITLAAGCGYSEEEWQAQLGKYNQLSSRYEKEKTDHAATVAELEATKKRVALLTNQLKAMGVNVDSLTQKLEQEGTEKQRLMAEKTEIQRALEEYKKRAEILERIKQRFEQVRAKLMKLTELGLKVSIRNNRMVISLPGDVLFESGQDDLQDKGKEVIRAVAEVIRKDPQLQKRYFQIAGHTDNKPLKGGRFGDNWGLSVMRARQVLLYLIAPVDAKGGGGGLDPARLHAAGYGETDPVASNASDDGRKQNRRVELVMMPDVEEMLDLKTLI